MIATPDNILDLIVRKGGNCLRDDLCNVCPFVNNCHSRFMNNNPPSRDERLAMALDVIVGKEIVGENKIETNISLMVRDKRV